MVLASWKRPFSSNRPSEKAAAEPCGPRAAASRASEDGLSVEVIQGHSSVRRDVASALTVLFRIQVPPPARAEVQRPPVQVACVLDCSGSMAGGKMEFAKRGVMKLVKHLGPDDTLHFVAYSSSAAVIFRDGDLSLAGKEDLRAKIMGLWPEGSTNLHGGLSIAASLLLESASHNNLCNRMFLLSDGLVNTGVTNSEEILTSVRMWARYGIKTSTFGIGVDFDEPLMRSIASSSGGHYCYFSSKLAIPGLISKAVHNMLSLYGTEATMQVTACDHVHISHLHGGAEDEGGELGKATSTECLGSGKLASLHLGDLVYGDRRWVLVSTEVLPKMGGPFQVLEWTLGARASGGGSVTSRGVVEVEVVTDAAQLAAEHISVRSIVSLQRAADLEQQVMMLLAGKGRRPAHQVQAQQVVLLTKAVEDASSQCVPEAEMLARALKRVQLLEERFRTGASKEDLRRQAAEERDKERSMSITEWQSGEDSSVLHSNSSSRHSSPASRDTDGSLWCASVDSSSSSSTRGAGPLLRASRLAPAKTPMGKAQCSQRICQGPSLPELTAPRGPSAFVTSRFAPKPSASSSSVTAGPTKQVVSL